MEESFLITGNNSPVYRSLLTKLVKTGARVIATLDAEQEEILFPDSPGNLLCIKDHDHRSPLSTRAVFLDLMNKGMALDAIVISHSILSRSEVIQNLPSRQVESSIDRELKGLVFFIREAIMYLERQGRGSINLVLHNSGPEIAAPMDALIYGAIESFGTSLFTYYGRERYGLRGYISREPQEDEYAEFILSSIAENKASGRWHSFKGRSRIFPLGRN